MMRSPLPGSTAQHSVIEALRERLSRREPTQGPIGAPWSTGCAKFDRLLWPGKGRQGTLVEWLSEGTAHFAATLAWLVARQACRETGTVIVLDRAREFYPPAARAMGWDFSQLVVVAPADERTELWALDQCLRCPGVDAVIAQRERLTARDFRRLQLAAESGGTLGLLMRPARARGQPSWADTQLLVQPQPSAAGPRWRVELLRCRGGTSGQVLHLEWERQPNDPLGTLREVSPDETPAVYPLPELAAATPPCRAAGA